MLDSPTDIIFATPSFFPRDVHLIVDYGACFCVALTLTEFRGLQDEVTGRIDFQAAPGTAQAQACLSIMVWDQYNKFPYFDISLMTHSIVGASKIRVYSHPLFRICSSPSSESYNNTNFDLFVTCDTYFCNSWDRRQKEVVDDEIDTNFASAKSAGDKTGEKFETVKETIDKQLE